MLLLRSPLATPSVSGQSIGKGATPALLSNTWRLHLARVFLSTEGEKIDSHPLWVEDDDDAVGVDITNLSASSIVVVGINFYIAITFDNFQ